MIGINLNTPLTKERFISFYLLESKLIQFIYDLFIFFWIYGFDKRHTSSLKNIYVDMEHIRSLGGYLDDDLVSVIVPTYNRPNELSRALNSIVNQTYDRLEIIVVDDCSETNTEDVIDAINDDRISLIPHERNMGSQRARNNGVKRSSGNYIAFLDDDDEWLPSKIDKQVSMMRENPKAGLVYCGADYVRSVDGKVVNSEKPIFKGDVSNIIFTGSLLTSATPVIRREVLLEAEPFDESLPSCQDWDMWIRISKICEFDFVDEILARYHVHGDQISSNYIKRILGREIILRKYHDDIESTGHLPEFYHWLGTNTFMYGDAMKGKEYERMAIELDGRLRYRLTRILFNLGPPLFHSLMKVTGNLYEI